MTSNDKTLTDLDGQVTKAVCLPAPQLFLLLQSDDLRVASSRHALSYVDEVMFGRDDARTSERAVEGQVRRLRLRINDRRASKQHATLTRTDRGWLFRDSDSRNGSRVDGVRTSEQLLRDGATIELGQTFFRFRASLPTPPDAIADLRADQLRDRAEALRTLLPELEVAFDRLARVARLKVPMLFLGETGTGKEWLARASHELSARRGHFIAINCAALPEALREAQLFGHVRGAFSGATRDEPGFVRAADGGSLFLDEIGDLAASSQSALLRVLQENEVVPVGATRPIAVDLRLFAATHAALLDLAEGGEFRNDLFARIAGFSFQAPALRDRLEDIGLLISAMLPELERAAGTALSFHPDAVRRLLSYDWPRNVRELKQGLHAAAVLAEGGVVEPHHLPPALGERADSDERSLHDELLARFAEHRGNVTQVARAMGKARVQVQRWMKRFDLDPTKFR